MHIRGLFAHSTYDHNSHSIKTVFSKVLRDFELRNTDIFIFWAKDQLSDPECTMRFRQVLNSIHPKYTTRDEALIDIYDFYDL